MITLTQERLKDLCTERGGYTKATLSALGVDWPPKKGWKARLVGKVISPDEFSDAEYGKGYPLLFPASANVVESSLADVREPETDFVIKPIPTEYAGVRFRSRLEARWAMLLDDKKIRWVYEVEGYELPDGGWYLPDFWLPDIHTFLEVKGPMQQGIEKVWEFAAAVEDENHKVELGEEDDSWWYPRIFVVVGTETGEVFRGTWAFLPAANSMEWGQCVECLNWWIYDNERAFTCRHCGAYDGDDHFNRSYSSSEYSLPQWKA